MLHARSGPDTKAECRSKFFKASGSVCEAGSTVKLKPIRNWLKLDKSLRCAACSRGGAHLR
jgi:hypothetical protein